MRERSALRSFILSFAFIPVSWAVLSLSISARAAFIATLSVSRSVLALLFSAALTRCAAILFSNVTSSTVRERSSLRYLLTLEKTSLGVIK